MVPRTEPRPCPRVVHLPRPNPHRLAAAAALAVALAAAPASARQDGGAAEIPPDPPPVADGREAFAADRDAIGLPILDVGVVGNDRVSDARILNAIRTAAGTEFDPAVVQEDYQRIYDLRRFRRVEGRYEVVARPGGDPPRGVRVVFEVEELPAVAGIRFEGNRAVDDRTLRRLVEAEAGFTAGERGDPALLGFAAAAVERYYNSKGRPLAQVRARRDEETGATIFSITEGPRVRVRNIDVLGGDSFDEDTLKGQVRSRVWAPLQLFGYNGRFDPETVEEDVASLQQFYRLEKGFFDARVGRRIVWSPDLSEVQIEFLVDEGRRYRVGEVRFSGAEKVDDAELRAAVIERAGVVPGEPYEASAVRRAIDVVVGVYGPLGYIYSPPPPGIAPDPDYLSVNPQPRFRMEEGVVDLEFVVSEGRPFTVGEIRVRGNGRTQDKVILRAFDLAPGEPYDSAAVQRGQRRLGASRYFSGIRVTPVIPDDPEVAADSRDLLVEVEEQSTATLTFGGSVSSNGGVFGSITYEQTNFDAFDFPSGLGDLGESFTGAGQTFRAVISPGSRRTSASVSFFEPYLFDRNFGFGLQGYFNTFRRREYRQNVGGGRVRFVPRLGRRISTGINLRGENNEIYDVDGPLDARAQDILDARGHTTITSLGLDLGYTRVDSAIEPTGGFVLDAGWETFGVLGGPSFQRVLTGADGFVPLYRDGRDRAIVLEGRVDAGAIYNDAPFFERFYAGGFGSVRGFRFRGISPRQGPADDAIGGDFSVTGSAALGFPIYDRGVRGVIFSDFGTVDDDVRLTTMRVSAGFGFRLNFGALGGVPIAVDFAWPVNKRDEDDLQVFSFSLGVLQ